MSIQERNQCKYYRGPKRRCLSQLPLYPRMPRIIRPIARKDLELFRSIHLIDMETKPELLNEIFHRLVPPLAVAVYTLGWDAFDFMVVVIVTFASWNAIVAGVSRE
ncbi:hypothetical protein BDV06DRAFT_184297 [Aspergillus oleicola]